eukprot:7226115-Alexandrium_andersonii.AAC.1
MRCKLARACFEARFIRDAHNSFRRWEANGFPKQPPAPHVVLVSVPYQLRCSARSAGRAVAGRGKKEER